MTRVESPDGAAKPPAANAASRLGRRSIAAIPRKFRHLLSLDDFEAAARRFLPRPLYGYTSGGVEDGVALASAGAAYRDYVLVPRFCTNVEGATARTEFLGESWGAPFGIAPMGLAALNGYRGDIALAEAAREAGVPMVISGSSLIPLEEIAAVYPGVWFQAYIPPDSERLQALLTRVRAAGISTIVVTVDSPIGSNRENNLRSGFSSPLRPSLRLAYDGLARPRWLVGTFLKTLWRHGMPHFENLYAYRSVPIISRSVQREFGGRARFSWDDLKSIRADWKGRLIVKGILHPEDAHRAAAIGVDAIVVSAHGGRQLDAAVAPLHVLPLIRDAVPDMSLVVDSGIRRGTDVVKAVALGADFVLVGRPFNYAAALGGRACVGHAISILEGEVQRTLGQIGLRRISEVTRAVIARRGPLAQDDLTQT